MTTAESTRTPAATTSPGWRATLAAYVALTKPRIIELLLVTTVPVMFLAERGVPDLWLVLATLVGGTLSAGAANTFNMVYDRDIDAQMGRTAHRPLVTGAVSPRAATIFGVALAALSTAWLWWLVNPLSAMLSLGAIVLYAVGYTMILKRRTAQNIVWGGVAGCMPTLIGWSAVRDEVGWPAVILFLVIFFWTPPHYWPLSMRFTEDYARAGVPMAPVVHQQTTVAKQIVAYSWVMVATSLVLVPVANMGWVYLVAALVSGAMFVLEAHRLLREARRGAAQSVLRPMRLFHFSITYVSVLFLGVAVDPLLHLPLA
ncbi:heme o synthase [Janibacter alkaliphilus]|uniref:Protoheme IX farnesyltransferase n=1 Tax=Janibacter alkaliphilus TaxID=1069963 RepID=A0A852X6Z0_9MICO|nr:protoheme IX farnesyltransferase [Janibacter alkaliphilus]